MSWNVLCQRLGTARSGRSICAMLVARENTSIVSLPSCTAFSKSGNMVSKPGNPGGGFSEDFS
ncbi:hypothetical protein DBV15_07570 [Temnothorax longispinosus]|uniref:Uncharacterized protein n=1 Tax=Temnothorax longispinosus TaxID=300112 RepID=A0A4S2L590_9HYME|nr:hypothetical protein DBV15_07570 [Temnothorax longispinosus]